MAGLSQSTSARFLRAITGVDTKLLPSGGEPVNTLADIASCPRAHWRPARFPKSAAKHAITPAQQAGRGVTSRRPHLGGGAAGRRRRLIACLLSSAPVSTHCIMPRRDAAPRATHSSKVNPDEDARRFEERAPPRNNSWQDLKCSCRVKVAFCSCGMWLLFCFFCHPCNFLEDSVGTRPLTCHQNSPVDCHSLEQNGGEKMIDQMRERAIMTPCIEKVEEVLPWQLLMTYIINLWRSHVMPILKSLFFFTLKWSPPLCFAW